MQSHEHRRAPALMHAHKRARTHANEQAGTDLAAGGVGPTALSLVLARLARLLVLGRLAGLLLLRQGLPPVTLWQHAAARTDFTGSTDSVVRKNRKNTEHGDRPLRARQWKVCFIAHG